MKYLCRFMIIVFFLASCATVPVGDTSQNALDWPGTYQCDKMTIMLRENNTYKALFADTEVRSSFRWDRRGRTIRLNHLMKNAPCKKFMVGENVLIPLKNSGRPMKEEKALLKVNSK